MVELLAALSASAAAGMRAALPLLVISLLQGYSFLSSVPVLSRIPSLVLLAFLASWSIIELFASKSFLGQRVLQLIQLLFSPITGGIMGVSVVQSHNSPIWLIWIVGIVSGLFALLLQLIQASWLYRLRGLPLWVAFGQDILCVSLVFLTLYAPVPGGLIALLLLWFSVRSYQAWQREKHLRP
ncbi:MAG: DUF4126 domain-containing protein [Chroococcidiopsidaceae cyanobacterium CP_BM_ER_R8_30]|nr:DUF4126 domain-containing protein [Chroococcidiopsidaceae cyanobacterium CP_BM_ER_R8_30]